MDQNNAPNILARLEELRLWQEQHQNILLDKPCTDEKLLNRKQLVVSKNLNNIVSDDEDVGSLIDLIMKNKNQ